MQISLIFSGYGGIYVPHLAFDIDDENNDPDTKPGDKINLKGLIFGNGAVLAEEIPEL